MKKNTTIIPILDWARYRNVKPSTAYYWVAKNFVEHQKKGNRIYLDKNLKISWLPDNQQRHG